MLSKILTINNKLKYVCLSKEQQEQFKKDHPFKSEKPKCYSCGCEEVIHSWYAEDENGNKAYTCSFCLDAYTDWPGTEMIDCETELDFSLKKVLKQFRVVVCDCDRSFITACRSDKHCCDDCRNNSKGE